MDELLSKEKELLKLNAEIDEKNRKIHAGQSTPKRTRPAGKAKGGRTRIPKSIRGAGGGGGRGGRVGKELEVRFAERETARYVWAPLPSAQKNYVWAPINCGVEEEEEEEEVDEEKGEGGEESLGGSQNVSMTGQLAKTSSSIQICPIIIRIVF